jgi:AAA ATPase-like protein
MLLTQLSIQRYRSIIKTEKLALKQLTVLVGPNNEGKSNILQALVAGMQLNGIPRFSPHALRHRRISLLHRQGVSWAEIGEQVGQRSRVTADIYSHALFDGREIDRTEAAEASDRRPRTCSCGAYLGAYPERIISSISRDVRSQVRPSREAPLRGGFSSVVVLPSVSVLGLETLFKNGLPGSESA